MFCSTCGSPVGTGATFCGTCGHALRLSPAPVGWSSAPMTADGFPVAVSAGSGYSTAAIILGVLAIIFVPILLGSAGIVLGAIGKSKGEAKATAGIVVAACGTVIGMIFGALTALAALS
jgi:zinc ribbon protein